MAFVIDNNKGDTSSVTSTPLSGGAGTSVPQPQPQQDQQPQQTAPPPQTDQGQKSPRMPTPSKSSGSGMFTNIQKYVEKNKPKTQEMAQQSLDSVRQANEDAKRAQEEAVSKFQTRAESGGMHQTDDRVAQLEQYTRDQAGFNGEVQPVEQEPQMTAQDEIRAYNEDLRGQYDRMYNIGSGVFDVRGGYDSNLPTKTVEYEDWLQIFNPDYDDRIQDIYDKYSKMEVPASDNMVDSNGKGLPMIDERQFENIINAAYGGPKSLVETGNIYRELARQAKESARMGENTQTDQGRKQLLRDVFSGEDDQYGAGLANLDAYLLGKAGNEPGEMLQQIINAGSSIGSQQDILREASRQATGIASEMERRAEATRKLAREKFKATANERQTDIDNRINNVIENWDNLPAHFREAFSSPDGSPNISAIEANIVGVSSGEGLYGLQGKDLFAEKGEEGYVDPVTGKLISKQESSNLQRLRALSNLARTEEDLYTIKDDYTNFDQAGTQSAMDALNLKRVREKLAEAEQNFRDFAAQNVRGTGRDYHRYSPGAGQAGEKVWKSATADANLKDILADQGYDFDSEISTADESNIDLLKNLASLTDINKKEGIIPEDVTTGMEIGEELLSGQAGLLLERLGLSPSDLTLLSTAQNITNEVGRFGDNLGGVGGDIISGVSGIGSDIIGGASTFVDDVGRQIFGGGKSAAKKKAYAKAKKKAIADLKQKLQKKYEASNFDKRINIDNESTADRDKSLMELLGNIDKTNMEI